MAKRKDPAAVSLGRRGGRAFWASLTPSERTQRAREVVQARWDKMTKAERKKATLKARRARKRKAKARRRK